MHHFRYNLTSALGAVVWIAVGFAALREANDYWDTWTFSLTLGLLLVAVLLAVHRTVDRRAFWIGFALFGWGYFSLSLIPSTRPRLITTMAIAHLHGSSFFGERMYVMRVIPDLDRLRVHNVSLDDLIQATKESGMVGTPEQEQLRRAKQTLKPVRGESVVGVVGRSNEPKSYENIILKASPEGEVLRLKDVARVESESSFIMPGGGAQTSEDFNDIGHTLLTLLVAWLGGLLSNKVRSGLGRTE